MRNALDTGKILHNRFVLYFVLFLALADLLFLAMGREFVSVSIFILSGFVTSFFSKNMMVVMCVAMVITNILKYGTDIRIQEGLKEGADTTDKATNADKPADAKAVADSKVVADTKAAVDEKDEKADADKKTTTGDMTPEQVAQFKENMEKLQAYEPLFKSMDKLMEKTSELLSMDFSAMKK